MGWGQGEYHGGEILFLWSDKGAHGNPKKGLDRPVALSATLRCHRTRLGKGEKKKTKLELSRELRRVE